MKLIRSSSSQNSHSHLGSLWGQQPGTVLGCFGGGWGSCLQESEAGAAACPEGVGVWCGRSDTQPRPTDSPLRTLSAAGAWCTGRLRRGKRGLKAQR